MTKNTSNSTFRIVGGVLVGLTNAAVALVGAGLRPKPIVTDSAWS